MILQNLLIGFAIAFLVMLFYPLIKWLFKGVAITAKELSREYKNMFTPGGWAALAIVAILACLVIHFLR